MSYVYVPGNRPGINCHLIYENGKPIRANLYEVDLYVTVPNVCVLRRFTSNIHKCQFSEDSYKAVLFSETHWIYRRKSFNVELDGKVRRLKAFHEVSLDPEGYFEWYINGRSVLSLAFVCQGIPFDVCFVHLEGGLSVDVTAEDTLQLECVEMTPELEKIFDKHKLPKKVATWPYRNGLKVINNLFVCGWENSEYLSEVHKYTTELMYNVNKYLRDSGYAVGRSEFHLLNVSKETNEK